MRKLDFYLCKNKGADKGANQLRGNHAAGQHLCFCYMDSTIPLLPGSTARFVSNLVGNPEDRFSHDTAHLEPVSQRTIRIS